MNLAEEGIQARERTVVSTPFSATHNTELLLTLPISSTHVTDTYLDLKKRIVLRIKNRKKKDKKCAVSRKT